MSKSPEESEAPAAKIAAQATAVAAVAERIATEGEGFLSQGRLAELKGLADSLVESRQILEQVLREAASARAVLTAPAHQNPGASWVARYVGSSDDVARANAAFEQKMKPALLAELVKQSEARQAAAAEMARSLIAEHAELRELAATQNEAVQGSLQILAQELGSPDAITRWLSTDQPDLDMRTPMQVMSEGHADAVERMLSDALKGIPS